MVLLDSKSTETFSGTAAIGRCNVPLWKRKSPEERAAAAEEKAVREAAKVEERGQKALESMRRIAEDRRLNPTGEFLSPKRRSLLLELEKVKKEAAQLNKLAKTDYGEANRLAGPLNDRLDRLNRDLAANPLWKSEKDYKRNEELKRYNAKAYTYGSCPRCASHPVDLTDGGRYFVCPRCGSRGRYDIYTNTVDGKRVK